MDPLRRFPMVSSANWSFAINDPVTQSRSDTHISIIIPSLGHPTVDGGSSYQLVIHRLYLRWRNEVDTLRGVVSGKV